MLCCLLAPGASAAETGKRPPASPAPAAQPQKTVAERFLEGLACLKQSDALCARIALSGINPSSPYAKILEARLAAARQDFDSALRLLIPLQAESGLLPTAHASLHATLALAYENRENPLRALEQRCQAEPYLAGQEEIDAKQRQLWQSLAKLPREMLLEMRGESPDTVVQGWIDLALAMSQSGQRHLAAAQWRSAYPGHPAGDGILHTLTNSAPVNTGEPAPQGKIALLLPLEIPAFAPAAHAVQAGFMAAAAAAQGHAQIQIYPTQGDRDTTAFLYRRAVGEGARYVVGPLTREEVGALESPGLVTIPTLALNAPEQDAAPAEKLLLFGLPVEEEARQLAGIARAQGLQSAIVAVADTPLAKRMARAFAAEWTAQEGTIVAQAEFSAASDPAELQAQLAARPADMIFLAANAGQARLVRPHLDQATPTFGLSHLYDGDPGNPLNDRLSAIHFVDMPWLLDPADPEYAAYRPAAAALPSGEAQRWFAVGVDAWHILSAQARDAAGTLQLRGLSGKLTLQGNRIVRELPLAQFRSDGVAVERMP